MCLGTTSSPRSTTGPRVLRSADAASSTTSASAAEEDKKQLFMTLRDPAPDALKTWRMNLGLPWWLVGGLVSFEPSWVKSLVSIVSKLFEILVEPVLFWLLGLLPDEFYHKVMVHGFQVLLWLFQLLPTCITRRGVADEMSTEAHLMSLTMWPARLCPVTVGRMRFALKGLGWSNPAPAGLKEEQISVPEAGVQGIWLHTAPPDAKDPPVLLWFYGGAFLGGDVAGNRGIAARYAEQLGADVFLPTYRLLPEHTLEDALLDGVRAYEWLLTRKAASKIVAAGVSAGAGVLLNALLVAKSTDPEERRQFCGTSPTPQPAGVVLFGPFVDFSMPAAGSNLIRNASMDWCVSQRVLEVCMPIFLETSGPAEKLERLSPLGKDLAGLCPVHVSYSLHEACTDMCVELVKRLGAAGNEVATFTEPYMGHVFQMCTAFLPEGRRAELEAIYWLQGVISAAEAKEQASKEQASKIPVNSLSGLKNRVLDASGRLLQRGLQHVEPTLFAVAARA